MKLCAWKKCNREFDPLQPRISGNGRNYGCYPDRRFCSVKCRVAANTSIYHRKNLKKISGQARSIREIGIAVQAAIPEFGLAGARRHVALQKGMTEKTVAQCHKQHNKRKASARRSHAAHYDETRIKAAQRHARSKQLASQGKILAEVKNPDSIAQEMIAIYLKLHPEATSNGDVREIFGPVSDSTIMRARKLARIDPPKGRPRKKLVKPSR